MKKPSPRRTPLQLIWKKVTVRSCADGTLIVDPQWDTDGLGVLTRMYAARHLEKVIRAHLRGKP